MTVAADKEALRRTLRARRAALSMDELAAAATGIAAAAGALPGTCVAAFVGLRGEPPTLPLLDALVGAGRRVLLPVLLDDDDLDWGVFTGSEALVAGRRGLLQPAGPTLGADGIAAADLVLAPALAIDARGRRLGQGGGSYDRALARTTAPVVAIVHDAELVDAVPVEAHDQPVAGVLTPSGLRWLDVSGA